MLPSARNETLLVEILEDETLVYDLVRHRAHCLNRSAALIWRHCDGKTGIAAIAAAAGRELGQTLDEAAVRLALDRLDRAHLLVRGPGRRSESISRREVAKKLALTGSLAVLLPAVTSIIAPTPAQAASCTGRNQPCNPAAPNCCAGCQCNASGVDFKCVGSC
jgi:hypothetical protein